MAPPLHPTLVDPKQHTHAAKRHFFRGSGLSLSLIFFGFIFTYLVNVFLARLLHAAEYGDYSVAVSSIQFCSVFILMGSDVSVVKFLPEYIHSRDWASARGYLQNHIKLILFLGFLAFVIGIVLATGGLLLQNIIFVEQETKLHPVLFFIWAAPFFAITVFLGKILRSTNHLFLSISLYTLINPVLLGIGALLIVHYMGLINVYQTLILFSAILLITILLQAIAIYITLPREIRDAHPKYEEKRWRLAGIELMFSSFMIMNLHGLSIILLKIFDFRDADVGVLSAILTICSMLWLANTAVNAVISPLISPAVKHQNKKKLQWLMDLGNLIMFVIGILLMTFFVFYGKKLLLHFGPYFVTGYSSLLIIASAFLFTLCFGMSISFLQYSGRQSLLVNSSIISFLALILTGSLLSKYFGIVGAAWSLVIVQVGYTLHCTYLVKKHLDISPYYTLITIFRDRI